MSASPSVRSLRLYLLELALELIGGLLHEFVLGLPEGVLAFPEAVGELLFFADDALHGLHAPVVQLEPEQLLQARVLVQEGVVQGLLRVLPRTLLIHVVLHVRLVLVGLESVAPD